VPLGIEWIIVLPFKRTAELTGRVIAAPVPLTRGEGERLCVHRLGRHPLDTRTQLAEAFVDALVSAVDLADVADLAATLGAEGGEQHCHAGADVR